MGIKLLPEVKSVAVPGTRVGDNQFRELPFIQMNIPMGIKCLELLRTTRCFHVFLEIGIFMYRLVRKRGLNQVGM